MPEWWSLPMEPTPPQEDWKESSHPIPGWELSGTWMQATMKPPHLPGTTKSKYHCRVVRSLLFAFVAVLFVGCKSSPSFVGKWNSESEVMTLNTKTVTEHLADGTFKSVTTSEQTPGGTSLTVTDSGTWKLDGDKLTILYKDIDWKFTGGKPEIIKRATERFKTAKPTIIAEANRAGAGKIIWKSNDEFEYTDKESKKYIYRRQK